MKRNIGILIMAIAQLLNMIGIDVQIQQAEIDSIATAIGGSIAVVGTVHDIVRRVKSKKAIQK